MTTANPVHIPLLRHGVPYVSLEQRPLTDHRTGETIATVSQANPGLVARDLGRIDEAFDALQALTLKETLGIATVAAELFVDSALDLDGRPQAPEDFVRCQSATTAMPEVMCRRNMGKIQRALTHMAEMLAGYAGVDDIEVLPGGERAGTGPAGEYRPTGSSFAAILPNNSPGVHALWLPVPVLRLPLALKPGGREPWTPWRIVQAFIAAGFPATGFSFYPGDHGAGNAALLAAGGGMVFGGVDATRPWVDDPRVEVHGPGHSKIVLDDKAAGRWESRLEVIVQSIAENGGRSCVNASSIWTPANSRELADELARRLGELAPLPMDDELAGLCGFPDPAVAAAIDRAIESGLAVPGATDTTAAYRDGPRLVELDGTTFLRPTVVHCERPDHPLVNREFLFPFVTVVPAPVETIAEGIGPSLVVTALADDAALLAQLQRHGAIGTLNLGPVATCTVDWTRPVEGNLFERVYERRHLRRCSEAADVVV